MKLLEKEWNSESRLVIVCRVNAGQVTRVDSMCDVSPSVEWRRRVFVATPSGERRLRVFAVKPIRFGFEAL